MNTLANRVTRIRDDIDKAAIEAKRSHHEITLLAVSKKRTADEIRQLYHLGITQFGESYWQEAKEKMAQLADLPIAWHFIGPIQSNKTRPIAEHFSWVHSIDSIKVAKRLHDQRPNHLPPINALVQVNADREGSKSGLAPEELDDFLRQTHQYNRLQFIGLMCLPLQTDDADLQRASFQKLRSLRDGLKINHPDLTLLSMGMSKDFKTAIQEQSDIVRIGTALFGARS